MKKKLWIILLITAIVISIVPVSMALADDDANSVTIVYTGDIKGNPLSGLSLAGVCAYVNELKSEGKNVELCDAGNAISGSIVSTASRGQYVLLSMNLAGYTIAAPGTCEFAFGTSRLEELVSESAVADYISANYCKTSNEETVFKPYVLKNYGETSVAFVGVTNPEAANVYAIESSYSLGKELNGTAFYSRIQAAIDNARLSGADYVILLGELPSESYSQYSAESLVANVSGVSAIINSGTSVPVTGMSLTDKDGGTVLYTAPGAGLKRMGVMTITPGKQLSTTLISTYGYRDINANDNIVALSGAYSSEMAKVVAACDNALTVSDSNGLRTIEAKETNMGDLVADAYRAATGAQIGLARAGEIRNGISNGVISYKDISSALSTSENLNVISVSGYDLLDAVEMAVRLYPSRSADFLQISGLTFEIESTVDSSVVLSGGDFLSVRGDYRSVNVKVGGVPIRASSNYTVAVSDSMISDDSPFTMFKNSEVTREAVVSTSQALYEYIVEDLGGNVGQNYSKSQLRIDAIVLVHESEIEAMVQERLNEVLNNRTSQGGGQNALITLIQSAELKASSSKSVLNGKTAIKLTWTVGGTISASQLDGYEVFRSTSKSSGYGTKPYYTTKKQSYTNNSNLVKGKTYYYKVRGYKTINGTKYYTPYSTKAYRKVS